jgi:hypothetical protein
MNRVRRLAHHLDTSSAPAPAQARVVVVAAVDDDEPPPPPPAAGRKEATTVRMLRSAWEHGSLALSERNAPRGHRVLSDADHDFLAANGWLLVPGAVEPDVVQRCVGEAWEYLGERWGMHPGRPDSWYHQEHMNGHVKKYQGQGQWDVRQSPRVFGSFADLWGTDQLWCSVDSTHMNPPQREGFLPGIGCLHIDLSRDIMLQGRHFRLQGEVLLTDVDEDGGGFACVPGFHLVAAKWARERPDSLPASTRSLDLHPDVRAAGYEVKTIGGRAGDLLIWDGMLPHSNSPNRSTRPRMIQIVTMFPHDAHSVLKTEASSHLSGSGIGAGGGCDMEEERNRRIVSWKHGLDVCAFIAEHWSPDQPFKVPPDKRYLVDSQGRFPCHSAATLTTLGEKLLGLSYW